MSETTAETSSSQDSKPQERGKWHNEGQGYLIGNLCDMPSLRYTDTGRPICLLRIASSTRVEDDVTGEWRDGPTEYADVAVWGKQGERCAEHLEKGDRIVTVGRWQSRDYVNRDGEVRKQRQLVARDIGASMLFRSVRIMRKRKSEGGE